MARGLISTGDDPIDWAEKIAPRPTFFVCGTADRIVDYRQTVALHERAGQPKQLHVIEGGGHVDSLCKPAGKQQMLEFFTRCLP